jgi:hypothetical protein
MPHRSSRLGPWKLVSPYGIQLEELVWNTGSVWSVYPLSNDRLLIGTEQGGLWLSEPDAEGLYQSRCLSDSWDHWAFESSVGDPSNSNRVFFGTEPGLGGSAGVYIGNFDVQPESWVYVPLPDAICHSGSELRGGSAGVESMIVLPGQRLLVVATGVGIGWMQIDTQPYTWYTSPRSAPYLANLPGDDFLFVATTRGLLNQTASLNKGSISGGVTFGSTSIPPGAIRWNKHLGRPTHPPVVTPFRIASCNADRKNVYCLGNIKRSEVERMFVIRSQDGANTWQECSYSTNLAGENLADVLGFEEGQPKSSYSIAVHPIDPDIVATGYEGGALSTDGGVRWNALESLQGWHADIHDLLFHLEPLPKGTKGRTRLPRRYSLYIPSDGGILRWTGADAHVSYPTPLVTADSTRNRSLPIVMLYSPDGRRDAAFGNLSVAGELLASGSQDNANLWMDRVSPAWRRFRSGDGGATTLASPVISPTVILGSDSLNKIAVRTAARTSPSDFGTSSTVPIRLNPFTLDATGVVPEFLKPVGLGIGLIAGSNSSPVIAIASPRKSNVVYAAILMPVLDQAGAFLDQSVEWVMFGNLASGELVSCLEPHDNKTVLVGTASGRMFSLKEQANPSEISFKEKPSGAIQGIASNRSTIACFATLDRAAFSAPPQSQLFLSKSPPHTKFRKGMGLLSLAAFPRNDALHTFHSLCANRSTRSPYLSFAVTVDENEVWVCKSSDLFAWQRVDKGLPRAIRCSDVVFSESSRSGELLLSSYGRGVWRMAF